MNNFYELVKSDNDIIKIYNKINEYEDKEKQRAYHDYNHVLNVSKTVKELLESLKYDKDFIDEAQVAAMLHDTGCTEGKEDHEIRSYEFAKDYLKKNNIQLKNKDMVLEDYFTSKVFKAIRSFSDKMKLKSDVFINNEKWMAFYEI